MSETISTPEKYREAIEDIIGRDLEWNEDRDHPYQLRGPIKRIGIEAAAKDGNQRYLVFYLNWIAYNQANKGWKFMSDDSQEEIPDMGVFAKRENFDYFTLIKNDNGTYSGGFTAENPRFTIHRLGDNLSRDDLLA